MFTGIVQAQGTLTALDPSPAGKRLFIDRSRWQPPAGQEPRLGDSVCISGVCLTVVTTAASHMSFDVIPETLDKSKLGKLRVGDPVNLEPSVTPNQPLGGHFMQGHIDGVGQVTHIQDDPADWRVTVRPPAHVRDCIIAKGSIAIDGVSLTIASLDDADAGLFSVALIPTTLQLTTMGSLRVGDSVNLEADILAKTVLAQLSRLGLAPARSNHKPSMPINMSTLAAAGFLG